MWLLIMREARGSTCLVDYINEKLKNKEIGNLGKVFNYNWDECFYGAYTSWLGSGRPTFNVHSQGSIDNDEATVGLFVHELLHNLGVGHTQKRPGKTLEKHFFSENVPLFFIDRNNYITVNSQNIKDSGLVQYKMCEVLMINPVN